MLTKRTYIAARFSAKPIVRELASLLNSKGYDVESRWIEHEYEHPGGVTNPENDGYSMYAAARDFEDASRASLMIVLLDPDGHHFGWEVEHGIGLALADEVWVVGPVVNVFSFLHGLQPNGCMVRRFHDVDDLKRWIEQEGIMR